MSAKSYSSSSTSDDDGHDPPCDLTPCNPAKFSPPKPAEQSYDDLATGNSQGSGKELPEKSPRGYVTHEEGGASHGIDLRIVDKNSLDRRRHIGTRSGVLSHKSSDVQMQESSDFQIESRGLQTIRDIDPDPAARGVIEHFTQAYHKLGRELETLYARLSPPQSRRHDPVSTSSSRDRNFPDPRLDSFSSERARIRRSTRASLLDDEERIDTLLSRGPYLTPLVVAPRPRERDRFERDRADVILPERDSISLNFTKCDRPDHSLTRRDSYSLSRAERDPHDTRLDRRATVPATETHATGHHTDKSAKMDPDPDDDGSDDDKRKPDRSRRPEKGNGYGYAPRKRKPTSSPDGDDSPERSSSKPYKSRFPFKKWLLPEKFDGSTPLSIFLTQMDTCAVYNGWSDSDKLAHMRLALRGNAAQLLSTQADISTYSKLVERITMRFGTDGQSSLFKAQLRARRRGPTETLQSLYQDISRLMAFAYPGPESTHSDAVAVDAFVDAIDDEKLELRIHDREPRNLDEAFKAAVTLEANQKTRTRKNEGNVEQPPFRARPERVRAATYNNTASRDVTETAACSEHERPPIQSHDDGLRNSVDQLVRVVGDLITHDRVASSPSARPKSDQFPTSRQDTTQATPAASVTCAYCRRRGHRIEDCRTRARAHPSAPPTSKFDNACFNCSQEGHYSRRVPLSTQGWVTTVRHPRLKITLINHHHIPKCHK